MNIPKMAALSNWLRQKTAREQFALLIASILIVVLSVWYFLIQPIYQSRQLAEQRVASGMQSLATVQQLAQELIALRNTTDNSGSPQSLSQLLDVSAGDNGVRISSLEPTVDGRSVFVRVDNSGMVEFLQWISIIEGGGHMALDAVTVTPGSAQQVTATLRVRSLMP
jgi:type II secretory pathway component PulM